MKTNSRIETDFLKTYNAEIARHQNVLDYVLERAGDKYFALNEHLKFFDDDYLNDQKVFPKLLPFLNKVEKTLKLNKRKSFYEVLENSREYQEIGGDFTVFLAVIKAKHDFSGTLHQMSDDFTKNENENASEAGLDSNFKFEWSNKLTQRNFAKIFYALKEAGFLRGDITKIVPAAAKVLDFKLGKEWKTNFSKGKHKVNIDISQVAIFETLKDAYAAYYNGLNDKQIERTEK
jgi:hypothetical protein